MGILRVGKGFVCFGYFPNPMVYMACECDSRSERESSFCCLRLRVSIKLLIDFLPRDLITS